jgi:hypothetical protein
MRKFILWQDVFLLVVDIFLVAILSWYVRNKSIQGLWRSASSDAGVALTVYFCGALFNRVAGVAWHEEWITASQHVWLTVTATIMLLVGATCILRLFAEYAWRWLAWAWVWCVVAATIIATIVLIFDR